MFRRLLGIKQLSHAYLVYPTAIHTRFEHSLGVTHLADRVSRHLSFDDEVREIVRMAALLHDIGHGPFSHLFETVMERVNGKKIDHEKISMMLIREYPDISSILGDMGEKVINILDHSPAPGLDRRWNKFMNFTNRKYVSVILILICTVMGVLISMIYF